MRHHPFLAAAVAACALTAVLGACSGDDPPAVEPTSEPSPTATAAPTTPPAEPAEPVEVAVNYVEPQLLDNAVLRGEPQREPSQATLDGAVENARAALERYLNAQFLDPATRFGSAAPEALLAEGAAAGLDAAQRRGLGETDLDLELAPAGPVEAQAVVLTDGDDLLTVTLVFDASFTVGGGAADGGVVRQHGNLLFPAQEGDRWRAEMAELTVELPEEPSR